MVTLKTIRPPAQLLDSTRVQKLIQDSLDAASLGIQTDFDTTVMTWRRQPDFRIQKPSEDTRIIGTEDQIYQYIDFGTRVRYATMSRDFRPKTVPNMIGSQQGRGRVLYISRRRPRPGIQARNFSRVIQKKWQDQFPTILSRGLYALASRI